MRQCNINTRFLFSTVVRYPIQFSVTNHLKLLLVPTDLTQPLVETSRTTPRKKGKTARETANTVRVHWIST